MSRSRITPNMRKRLMGHAVWDARISVGEKKTFRRAIWGTTMGERAAFFVQVANGMDPDRALRIAETRLKREIGLWNLRAFGGLIRPVESVAVHLATLKDAYRLVEVMLAGGGRPV